MRRPPRRPPFVVPVLRMVDAHGRLPAHHLGRALVAVARGAAVVDHAERAAGEAEHHDGGIDVADLGELGGGDRGTVRAHLHDLADHPARGIQVVDRHIHEEPSGVGQELGLRRVHVPQRRAEEIHLAQFARSHPVDRRGPIRIEPAVEAHLERDARRPHRFDGLDGRPPVKRDRLLAEDVFPGPGGEDAELSMRLRRRGDRDGVDRVVGQDVRERLRPRDRETLAHPAGHIRVRVEHAGKLGRGAPAGQVGGMDPAHPAQARKPDPDPARHAGGPPCFAR
jgi:hypothetical protein